MTLADFLLARIAEDEQRETLWERVDRRLNLADNRAYWSRKRRLAECEAKRRIVEWHASRQEDAPEDPYAWDDSQWASLVVWKRACKLLALPYADHPDYRDEWRP